MYIILLKGENLKHLTPEQKEKGRLKLIGRIPWNKGKKGLYTLSDKTKAKISESNKDRNINERNGSWKGDKVGYGSLHTWVRKRIRRPELCEACNEKKSHDMANVTGKYTRDLTNWKFLCRTCHQMLDIELGIRPSYSVIAKLRTY